MKLCNLCGIFIAVLRSPVDFLPFALRILQSKHKKEDAMAKGTGGKGGKVLKFDAAGGGLSKSEILKVCERENVRLMRL